MAPKTNQWIRFRERISFLEAEIQPVQDIKEIKRLQRIFGYYFDKGLWDEMADLFTEDATLEYARDGVYKGQKRIRKYFKLLGGSQKGLRKGQINEHFQLMPVITLSKDGLTANGRWRDLSMQGQYGKTALWGEGPYENEYIKENRVWKISKMQWFQTVLVPYDGGWVKNEDVNHGKYLSDIFPPDLPPTTDFGSWPETFLPPFHFSNPVATYEKDGSTPLRYSETPVPKSAPTDILPSKYQNSDSNEQDILVKDVQVIEGEIELLEAENEIENLQRAFGFYFDKKLWTLATDLFTDDASVEIGGDGVYIGKTRILKYFRTFGTEGPEEGILNDHMQLQPVIHVISDTEAKGRWHHFSQEAVAGKNHFWGIGIYENEYRKENGVWKISKLHLYSTMRTPYDKGWAKTALPRSVPDDSFPPDYPSSVEYDNYPVFFIPPFHYENPVTGTRQKVIKPERKDLPEKELDLLLTDLEKRAGLLKDAEEVERLHVIYGYYLARNQWDDLTEIFTPDGTIEIAQRGVYKNRKGIRRNLNLYGIQDELHGQLHNHMQYQPVIHVAGDGQTAYMRSRAFSMMGHYQGLGMWMGGIYENIFEKREGIWMLHRDQVFNTYFADYDEGWKDLQRRNPPGINNENPPDAPPTIYFEMYPSPFLPPFHYSNPVTGNK